MFTISNDSRTLLLPDQGRFGGCGLKKAIVHNETDGVRYRLMSAKNNEHAVFISSVITLTVFVIGGLDDSLRLLASNPRSTTIIVAASATETNPGITIL
jgi:hypothetical protein